MVTPLPELVARSVDHIINYDDIHTLREVRQAEPFRAKPETRNLIMRTTTLRGEHNMSESKDVTNVQIDEAPEAARGETAHVVYAKGTPSEQALTYEPVIVRYAKEEAPSEPTYVPVIVKTLGEAAPTRQRHSGGTPAWDAIRARDQRSQRENNAQTRGSGSTDHNGSRGESALISHFERLYREQLTGKDELIAELRHRAEAAEGEVKRLQQETAGPQAVESDGVSDRKSDFGVRVEE
jgi:hypothetical protein